MNKTFKKIFSVVLVALFSFHIAFAAESTNYKDENDGLYRYNALENKVSFMNFKYPNKHLRNIIIKKITKE